MVVTRGASSIRLSACVSNVSNQQWCCVTAVNLRMKMPFCVKRNALIQPDYYAGLGNNRGFWLGLLDLQKKYTPERRFCQYFYLTLLRDYRFYAKVI
jgi:hypothetical protein